MDRLVSGRISAIVATFGDPKWQSIAQRALGSLAVQTVRPAHILQPHGTTLAKARNQGALEVTGDYLLFLDADDMVDQFYVEAMHEAIEAAGPGLHLFQPATWGMRPDGSFEAEAPNLIPRQRLIDRNYLVIGTLVPRETFLTVGGFHEYDHCEDWDLFIRLTIAGARVTSVPRAVYVIAVGGEGRNSNKAAASRCYRQIRQANMEAWRDMERRT